MVDVYLLQSRLLALVTGNFLPHGGEIKIHYDNNRDLRIHESKPRVKKKKNSPLFSKFSFFKNNMSIIIPSSKNYFNSFELIDILL